MQQHRLIQFSGLSLANTIFSRRSLRPLGRIRPAKLRSSRSIVRPPYLSGNITWALLPMLPENVLHIDLHLNNNNNNVSILAQMKL